MIRVAHAALERYIEADITTPSHEKIWCTDNGHFLQKTFGLRGPSSRYAKHTMTVEEKDGVLVIERWVVANGNFGFHLDDIEVLNTNTFVRTICALRQKMTKVAVQDAYEAKYRRRQNMRA